MLPQTGVGGMGQAESRARDPDGAVHGAVAVAVADSAAPHLASVPADPPPGIARPQLGAILLRNGAIRADDLVRALELQTRRKAHLGDILRAHGLASDQAVMAALAEQFGTSVIDPAHSRPDPRLIDRLGPRRCLQIGCLPWSRAGACTLVACARPDQFHLHRDEIEAALGPVAMAVIPEPDLHAALLGSRRSALRLMAETCVAAEESCRLWNGQRFSRLAAAAAIAMLAATVAAPLAAFLGLFGLVLVFLVAGNLLKIAAAIANSRPRAAADSTVRGLRKPAVSIMVPLYREPDIAPRLVKRLGALTYPRELLDVMLVCEEDDHLTRDALAANRLPHWMRVIPVPDSALRTKPRALNYALNFARGEVIGVYDAEDAPAPDQLHRVVERFAAAGPDLACIQGVLDYYNPRTNWLSRCFTIEYAAWFRMILPGLARLGLVVPLGGTTLFFRRETLDRLGGWDAHNVTEDADLGLRLARHGYRTELMDSVTLEEANCRVWPWVKQRSRWLKGYAMTYAVHMRDPGLLWRQLGAWRFWGVQVLFLGTLVQFLLAPILWSFWLMLFGMGHPLTAALPHGALTGVAAMFLLSEVAGLAINIAALKSPHHRFLRPWTLSLHLYFPLAAVAAWKGCWEMISSPFYWDKTTHGIHDTAATTGPVRGPVSGS
ncbi:MAG: glycosyltransferase [Rhodobacter sp.]|nr:glycosyltransferase [Rhodobacter sp.]